MIHLDTTVLIDALTGPRRLAPALRSAIHEGERILLSSIVLYEWLRGPRHPAELDVQGQLFPDETTIVFDDRVAARAAALYRSVRNPRGRDIDLAIAACALEHGAMLWTLNRKDFDDVAGLALYEPGRR